MAKESGSEKLARQLQARQGLVLLVAIAVGIGVAVFYHNCKPWRATITFGTSVIGALFAIYTFRSGVEQNKRQMAHHLIERWNNPQMEEQKNVLRAVRWGGLDPKEFARPSRPQFAENDAGEQQKKQWEDRRSKIVAILSFCEEIALAVNAGSLREDLMRRWINHLLIDTFVDLMPWIEEENQKKGENPRTAPLRIYNEVERLALRWSGDSTRAELSARVKKEREQAALASKN